MRRRLAGCIAGAVLGLCLTSLVNDSLGLPPAVAFGACLTAGTAFGYVVTTLADVFIG
jgi:hydroxylamine reductase (hybrid-cluster protein)